MSNNLRRLREKIVGPVFSVVTPFKEYNDEINFEALERYIQYAYRCGARNFYVMGYNSRFSELSWAEIKTLNAFVVSLIKQVDSDCVVIVADPLHCSTAVSMEFCKHAQEIGADLISLIFREKFYSNDQVIKHFRMCAGACDIGILIHEMPFISGLTGHTVNWPVRLLDELADIENIIAIKEDAKEDEYSLDVISTIKDRLSIIISGGGKRQWLRFAEMGCQAWLNGIGVFEPRLAVRFWEAYEEGEQRTINKIIEDIERPFFARGVDEYGWHLAIKAALEARGHYPRHERMPMLAISDEEYRKFRSWFEALPIETCISG